MFHKIRSKIWQFKRAEKGAVLIFLGLSLLPILLLVGLAVDSSVGLQQKRALQAAVDAAANAGAANGKGDPTTTTSEAKKVFAINTNGMSNISGPVVNVNTSSNTVTVSASIVVTHIFMNLGGITDSTYNASATTTLGGEKLAEVVIVFEVSKRFASSSFHKNICTSLINFVNALPSNVMVSIIPIATEFHFDPANTVPDALFNHLSMTADDESANPGFYPLSTNYAWTSANFSRVQNPFYYNDGSYAVYPSDPNVIMSNKAPAMCPGGYASCSPTTWPAKCPPTLTNTSCSQVYSYESNASYPVLPLTLNKTLIINYLNGLKAYTATANGLFPSFISWGWRALDPAWSDFWMINSDASTTLRTVGKYPQAYGDIQKSIILIFKDVKYWDDYSTNVSGYYVNKCGDSTKVLYGVNHWWMTGYGMVPVPTDWQSKVNDITCENKWYKTMDKGLGLNLSDATNYNATVNTSSFKTSILNEVGSKFFRICNNIKAKNIDIYLLANTGVGSLSPCCNTSTNAYTIANDTTNITNALNSVLGKIKAKIGS